MIKWRSEVCFGIKTSGYTISQDQLFIVFGLHSAKFIDINHSSFYLPVTKKALLSRWFFFSPGGIWDLFRGGYPWSGIWFKRYHPTICTCMMQRRSPSSVKKRIYIYSYIYINIYRYIFTIQEDVCVNICIYLMMYIFNTHTPIQQWTTRLVDHPETLLIEVPVQGVPALHGLKAAVFFSYEMLVSFKIWEILKILDCCTCEQWGILLMEEIPSNHLGCIKPRK